MSDAAGAGAPIDLLVIGGGITGCAVARDAAARGLSVVLVERRDLASGTSGRSTKLLHGGLRYLEHGHLRLVREALREREITARLAPALSRPLRLILPVRFGAFPGPLSARLGVGVYDLLSGRSSLPRGRTVSAAELRSAAPDLAGGWTMGVAFSDRQTDDALLTVAIARDAKRRGAELRLGVAVTGLRSEESSHRVDLRDEGGATTSLVARCVVNAGGPWADRIRALAGRSGTLLRVTRGAHLVLRGMRLESALLLPGARRGHRLFAIPWRDAVLFGTTDVEDEGDPGRDLPEASDLRLLFDEARRLFPGARLGRSHVLSAFTGTRPLVRQTGDTLAMSREHRVVDEAGLVTIAGGKLTTWRLMAAQTLEVVARRLGVGTAEPPSLLEEPLPGGSDAEPDVDAAVADGFARHAEDVLFRRLRIGHDPSRVELELPRIVDTMARRLGWGAETRAQESELVLTRLSRLRARLDEALGPV